MANYIVMYQYTVDTFSVIHSKGLTPEINDTATCYHKTSLHKRDRTSNALNIIEVIETRPHKTDAKSSISIVKCEHQI